MEKKKKLPANRVRSKFDHQQSTDQSWLPSFGRVWSKGGTQQSKKYFQKMSSTTKKSSTISNFTASSNRDTSSSSVFGSENDILIRVESKMNGDFSVQFNPRKMNFHTSFRMALEQTVLRSTEVLHFRWIQTFQWYQGIMRNRM